MDGVEKEWKSESKRVMINYNLKGNKIKNTIRGIKKA